MKDYAKADFLQEEVRCGYTVTEHMKHVWAVELDLMEALKVVCERNNLRFFMAGGTLLGAVRHQGFIPWDDDADFLMPREDFEQLKKIAPHELEQSYFLQTEESDPDVYHGSFARLVNCETTGFVHLNLKHTGKSGIWIDISVLDNIYEDGGKRKQQLKKIRHYQRMLFAKTYKERDNFPGTTTLRWMIYKKLASFYNRNDICMKLKKALTCCHRSDDATCFTYHHDNYQPFPFKWEDYRYTVPLDFEWMKLPAPVGYERHLQIQYGDYMKFPPEIERTGIRAVLLDPFIPYDSFLINFERAADDIKGKTLIVFGAGQMLEHYLQNEGKKYPPEFVVDNDEGKWDTEVNGIPVNNPDSLFAVPSDERRIIICSVYYKEIAKQLREMGLGPYYIYVQEIAWL